MGVCKWVDAVSDLREDVDVAQRSKEHLKNGWAAGVALREESPTIVRHLADGCPTCNAGLQVFYRTGADAAGVADVAITAREQFENALAAALASAASPVQALHGALADLAVPRKPGMLEG
jgi:hypothetical protein